LKGVEVEASTLASTVPSVKGLYVVRAMTAEWLLGKDEEATGNFAWTRLHSS
jgi:hypothetical protein